MTYAVRELELGDIAAVCEIDVAAHGQVWSQTTFVDQVESADRHHLVVTHCGTVVAHGALWFDGSQARVTNVAVDGRSQRNGLGALVLARLCQVAVAHPTSSTLTLEVAPENLAAQGLYRRFGFAPVGVDRSFYGEGKDALVMSVADLTSAAWQALLADAATRLLATAKGAVV